MLSQKLATRVLILLMQCFIVMVIIISSAHAEDPYEIAWARQLGSSSSEYGISVAVASDGNSYISGYTYGALDGANLGATDAFLTKYNMAGSLQWTKQIGTDRSEYGYAVAVDVQDNVFIGGATTGSLYRDNIGGSDAFIAQYDGTGAGLWQRQLGTVAGEHIVSAAADGFGNVCFGGSTAGDLAGTNQGSGDAFLIKYSISATQLWKKQIGTSVIDECKSIAVDADGNVFISGYTYGNLSGTNQGGTDAFLCKYNSGGTLQWTKQLGTTVDDVSQSVAVDADGNVFISGYTSGSLGGTSQGYADAFLSKYDNDGALLWTRQLGTNNTDRSNAVAVDADGNVFISGYTCADLDGAMDGTFYGATDVFVSKYDSAGALLWIKQIGTSYDDCSNSMCLDDYGNVFITGYTNSDLGGTCQGAFDVLLIKLSPIPEPGALVMLAGIAVTGLIYWRRQT